MRPDDEIDHLLGRDHLVLRREHPTLDDALTRACTRGRIARVLPGVYADRAHAEDPVLRMAAVCRWDPNAVVQAQGAAMLTFWPKLAPPSTLQVASVTQHRPQPGFAFTRRRIPAELVTSAGPVRLTTPALTALELATTEFTDPIDVALHSRQVTLATLYDALRTTPQRPGNVDRRRVLLDSRAEPWSHAERQAHRLLRSEGITGWVANRKVHVGGATYFLDVGFDRERVAGEIDGRAHHCEPDVFESDRARQNALVLDGWLIVRFTWLMLTREPDYVIRTLRHALGARRLR
ncbi:type IV toxin-antitoxin system AbiEi family antitoxin domain-containing protein [Microlunatus aurantiacus]|uniref:Type IV toxin-antitoxin system AbiEi family antitoxin domain-containing protein n=1 Tax=Microlunatus aurantiacus TaxID=446786 RepID=A0ABP7CQG2_9ACTN